MYCFVSVHQCMSYSVPILIVCCHCCVFVKVILKEREEKKRLRLLEDGVTVDVSAEIDDVVGADDNSQQAGEQEENLSPDGTQVHFNLIVLAASCVFRTCIYSHACTCRYKCTNISSWAINGDNKVRTCTPTPTSAYRCKICSTSECFGFPTRSRIFL